MELQAAAFHIQTWSIIVNLSVSSLSLSRLQSTFWSEVERLAGLRGHPYVSPLSREVARAVFNAGLLALEDRDRGNRVHRTLASGTGTGKTSYAGAFASALLKTDPTVSVLFVCADIRQADETYRELSRLADPEEMAIWTSGHDAGTPLEKIRSSNDDVDGLARTASSAKA